jgi:hypothetical protein
LPPGNGKAAGAAYLVKPKYDGDDNIYTGLKDGRAQAPATHETSAFTLPILDASNALRDRGWPMRRWFPVTAITILLNGCYSAAILNCTVDSSYTRTHYCGNPACGQTVDQQTVGADYQLWSCCKPLPPATAPYLITTPRHHDVLPPFEAGLEPEVSNGLGCSKGRQLMKSTLDGTE